MACFVLVVGEVAGSVSITKAKNNRDDDKIEFLKASPELWCWSKEIIELVAKAVAKNEITIASRSILRITNQPPMIITGAIYLLPTHQLATCPAPIAVRDTAIAAGLKICLPFQVKIYFEAMANPAAAVRKIKS